MAYTLSALIARCEVFAQLPPWAAAGTVIPLAGGVCMLPLDDTLLAPFGTPGRPWEYERHGIFMDLPEALAADVAAFSRAGRLAYVEAEFFGGDGEQRSAVWEDGVMVQAPEESAWAINDALRSLGVEAAEGKDRFDTVGLGRHRSVEEWIAAARAPLSRVPPPPPEPSPPPPAPQRPWWRFWG